MSDNHYTGFEDLREMTNEMMDATSHAHDILNRATEADELRLEHNHINCLQKKAREKLNSYYMVIKQAEAVLEGLEVKEDLLALRMLDLIHSDQLDADGIVGHTTAATRLHEGWVERWRNGLKNMFRTERISA